MTEPDEPQQHYEFEDMASEKQPDELYFLTYFGNCSQTPCACLKFGWQGLMCRNWTPLGIRSHEELKEWFSGKDR